MAHYKAVFSDIDGTLLTSEHRISALTAASIQRIVRQGIPFILVSARPPLAITPYIRELAIAQPIVCYSGALILDTALEPIYSIEIPPQDLSALEAAFARNPALSANFYHGLDWFAAAPDNDWVRQEAEITGCRVQPKPAHLNAAHKILVMGEPPHIVQLESELKAQFPHLSIHRSKPTYLEIMHQAATKSSAIRFMESLLNVQPHEVVAFGDNFNDLDMLEYAGLGVAMGNAPAEIKQAAQRITASNNEDGISLVLDELF